MKKIDNNSLILAGRKKAGKESRERNKVKEMKSEKEIEKNKLRERNKVREG